MKKANWQMAPMSIVTRESSVWNMKLKTRKEAQYAICDMPTHFIWRRRPSSFSWTS